MDNKLNFYDYGVKVATKSDAEIEKLAKSIQDKYGVEARDEFEIGIAASVKVNAHYDRYKAIQEMVNSYNQKYHPEEAKKAAEGGYDWAGDVLNRIKDQYDYSDISKLTEEEKRNIILSSIPLALNYAREHYNEPEVQDAFNTKK